LLPAGLPPFSMGMKDSKYPAPGEFLHCRSRRYFRPNRSRTLRRAQRAKFPQTRPDPPSTRTASGFRRLFAPGHKRWLNLRKGPRPGATQNKTSSLGLMMIPSESSGKISGISFPPSLALRPLGPPKTGAFAGKRDFRPSSLNYFASGRLLKNDGAASFPLIFTNLRRFQVDVKRKSTALRPRLIPGFGGPRASPRSRRKYSGWN
jgi:hypothetical protein